MRQFEQLVVANGGGMAKTLTDVQRFCKTPVTRITVGGITSPMRSGNTPVSPGDVYFYDDETGESGNSLGLPNVGMEGYRKVLPQMVDLVHAAGKELYANVNGESIDEIIELVVFCLMYGVDGVEINLACPNVHDKGVQKPLFCEDPELVAQIVDRLADRGLVGRQLSIKISPTEDDSLVEALCDAIVPFHVISEVVATNTRGGQRFIRGGIDKIAFLPPGSHEIKHVAGQAGRPLHKRSVEIVKILRRILPERVQVIGVGGNFDGSDVMDFLNEGADGFQAATVVMRDGADAFRRILNELGELYPA